MDKVLIVTGTSRVIGAATTRKAAELGEYVDYAASKGALDTTTVGLAAEVATEGISVNAVRPGVIRTEIHASGCSPTVSTGSRTSCR